MICEILKKTSWVACFLLFSCNNLSSENKIDDSVSKDSSITDFQVVKQIEKDDYQKCWRGQLNDNINVLIHYKIHDDIFEGYIIYTDTKAKQPIRLLGSITDNKYIRFLEFDKNGSVTGIIDGEIHGNDFKGEWFSPTSKHNYNLKLNLVDTFIHYETVVVGNDNLEGNYFNKYGKDGAEGTLEIKKIDNNKIEFSIFSMTDAPARNMAECEKTVVDGSDDFEYKIPDSENCYIRVRTFKDFVYVTYPKGNCAFVFGHNASLEGFYYKLK
jgi:hypothetical protein